MPDPLAPRRYGFFRGPLAGLLAGAALAVPGGSAAQDLEVGLGIARTQDPVPGLSDAACPAEKTWAAEGRAALRFSAAAALEGTFGYQFENAGECEDEVPPVPPTGPFEQVLMRNPEAGYPFVSTDLRLAFEPSSPGGPIWLRAFGGYGRMWGKDIGYWLAGAGLVFGGQLEALLDFEWNWFDVAFETTTRRFEDGVLTEEVVTQGEDGHSTFRIKAGVRWRP